LCRPRKKQRHYSSGKKQRPPQKASGVGAHKTREILDVAVGKGREHDCTLCKRSKLPLQEDLECLADRGYQGRQKRHPKSQTPKKKPPKGELNKQEKGQNRVLASRRVVGEHGRGQLKVFSILSEQYRNRRQRFGLRLHWLASLYNLDLKLHS
jgi:IS5 family transposase